MTGPRASTPGHDKTMRALEELTVLERTALLLVYWRNRTQVEVAAEMGRPVTEIQTAVARGLLQLAALIEGR